MRITRTEFVDGETLIHLHITEHEIDRLLSFFTQEEKSQLCKCELQRYNREGKVFPTGFWDGSENKGTVM